MIRHVRHLFTGLTLAAALSCSVFASAQTIYFAGGDVAQTSAMLGTITPTGTVTTIGSLSTQLSGIAFSPITGVLYGVSQDATTLFTVNPTTAALTTIGATGLSAGNADGLAFRADGTLFLANEVSNLYTVNPLTGTATLLGPIGNQSTGTIGFDASGVLYETNNQGAGSNRLDSLNQTTGAGTLIGNTGFTDIFGLAFSSGSLYGFTGSNRIITLSTATGLGTQISTYTLPNAANGNTQIILAATPFQGAVPEPSTLALLVGMGVTGTSVFLRRKRANPSA